MKTHAHSVTQYECEAAAEGRLQAIVLPLQKYTDSDLSALDLCGSGTASKDGDGNWIITFPKAKEAEKQQEFILKAYPKGYGQGIKIPFTEGDRIYLREEWRKACLEIEGDEGYFSFQRKSQYPDSYYTDWEPAHTMPPEAARHWFAIAEISAIQMISLSLKDFGQSGLNDKVLTPPSKPIDVFESAVLAAERWSAAYPEQPWDSDRWVIVLQVEAIAQ